MHVCPPLTSYNDHGLASCLPFQERDWGGVATATFSCTHTHTEDMVAMSTISLWLLPLGGKDWRGCHGNQASLRHQQGWPLPCLSAPKISCHKAEITCRYALLSSAPLTSTYTVVLAPAACSSFTSCAGSA